MSGDSRGIRIHTAEASLEGIESVPEEAVGIVLFVHGSGSSRHSPRNQQVAAHMRAGRLATLLFDLLTEEEEKVDSLDRRFRFDIELLARRLLDVTDWSAEHHPTLPVGYFGSSTGAAAALMAAARSARTIGAIVSRGGRPDLAESVLPAVESPTLLIVGGNDPRVLALNRMAFDRLACEKRLYVVEGATHLFEEPGALEEVAGEARRWMLLHLAGTRKPT